MICSEWTMGSFVVATVSLVMAMEPFSTVTETFSTVPDATSMTTGTFSTTTDTFSMATEAFSMAMGVFSMATTAELNKLKKTFSAFISADYMMGKNLPHWGSSAQPSKTYYMMKLVHDIFGLVDHTSKIKYAYLCDEVAAGPKSTDHTITFFDHFTKVYIDNWVRHLTLCLDNARICKNQYLVAWAVEMVESGRFDSIRFIYLTVGHTKFAPDQLFSSIANTFYNSDVFCIEMLHSIVQQYATGNIFTSRIMLHWRAALTVKYSAVCGITDMRDILVSMKSGKVYASYRKQCFQGDYHLLPN